MIDPTTRTVLRPVHATVKLHGATRSDIGPVRQLNEDASVVRDDIRLWAVADGMGGHSAGDYASRMIVENLSTVRARSQPAALLMEVVDRLERANASLRDEALERGISVIGSTVVCFIALEEHGLTNGLITWCGDSRAYLLRQGVFSPLTRDHSVVQQLVDDGLLDPEKAESHPQAHVLTQAVGAVDEIKLDYQQFHIEPGDVYLLCTDGLTRVVADAEIAEIIETHRDSESACEALIQRALEAGTRDNVTVVLIFAEHA